MPKTGAGKRAGLYTSAAGLVSGRRSRARAETGFPKSQPGKGALNELKKVFQNRDRATVL